MESISPLLCLIMRFRVSFPEVEIPEDAIDGLLTVGELLNAHKADWFINHSPQDFQ